MVFANVTIKGQVVIPSKMRRRFNIKAGTKVCIEEGADGVVIKPINTGYFRKFAGILKGPKKLSKMLMEERKQDRIKEDGRLR